MPRLLALKTDAGTPGIEQMVLATERNGGHLRPEMVQTRNGAAAVVFFGDDRVYCADEHGIQEVNSLSDPDVMSI
jgi:hypothetical protein